MANRLNTLIFHFIWGCKWDKIKRDIVSRSRGEGGIGLVFPYDFILSLKLQFLTNCLMIILIIHGKVLQQLMYPDHLVVALEYGAARRNCTFAQDILNCYLEWRTKSVAKNGGTIDQCV